jgi:hypothetical protein
MGDINSKHLVMDHAKHIPDNRIPPKNIPRIPLGKNPRAGIVPPRPIRNEHEKEGVKFLEPEIVERKNWELKHAGFAIILALFFVFLTFGLGFLLNEDIYLWIIGFVFLLIYAVIVYFLLEPKVVKEIRQPIIETELKTIEVEKPIPKNENLVSNVSSKKLESKELSKNFVVQKTIQPSQTIVQNNPPTPDKSSKNIQESKTIYVDNSSVNKIEKSPVLKYNFFGSKVKRVYHSSGCRLIKSINGEHLIKAYSDSLFKRMRYKPCNLCLKKKNLKKSKKKSKN